MLPEKAGGPVQFYLKKITKEDFPWDQLQVSQGQKEYEWARLLASILNPLTGPTTTYVHNAATVCDQIKRLTRDA